MTAQPDIEPLARQLMEQARALSRLQHDLDQLANQTTDSYADLLARLEERDKEPAARLAPAAYCWRRLGDQHQADLWRHLKEWVDWVRGRYPLTRMLPGCWSEHPEVVEELTALWLAWRAAYDASDAAPTAPIDWHDRWLPGFLNRLEHGPLALPCRSEHQARPASAYASFERDAS